MLINTVILFLRDALPIFVVLTILLSLLNQQGIKQAWCYFAIMVGLFSSITLLASIDIISSAIDGTGREWLYALFYALCYAATLFLLNQLPLTGDTNNAITAQEKKGVDSSNNINTIFANIHYCAVLIVSVVIMLKSSHFLIYISGFWTQKDAFNVLLTGMILGSGICTSIAVLLYFLMDIISAYYRFIREALLILFSAGLLMQSSNLLLQIDALPSGNFLWDSNDIVLENSEMGQLLNVFFGYDATPTLIQLLFYVAALVIAFIIMLLRTRIFAKKVPIQKQTIVTNNAKEAV